MRDHRRALIAVLVIGVGVAVAPAAFQMFSRAPLGGSMIEDFRPHMTRDEIDGFRGHLTTIGAAAAEVPASTDLGAVASWKERWPAIDAEMRDMLDTMDDNIGEFRGVSALPPFVLFPWFFVVPGVLIAGTATAALVAQRGGRGWLGLRRALVVLGVGVVAAPAIFQMFSRAPGGARMIDEFRPLMSVENVTTVQQYFLTIGTAEAELRTTGLDESGAADDLPATARFIEDWPSISRDMAPMIGAMSDNVDNFAAIDALPPFWLFPWFFVVPGVLVAMLAASARTVEVTDRQPLQAARRTAA